MQHSPVSSSKKSLFVSDEKEVNKKDRKKYKLNTKVRRGSFMLPLGDIPNVKEKEPSSINVNMKEFMQIDFPKIVPHFMFNFIDLLCPFKIKKRKRNVPKLQSSFKFYS